MVIVYGGVRVDPARVAEVTEAARTFQEKCRDEEGCVDYILSWDLTEPNRIHLVEAWDSNGTAEAHKTRAHVKEWVTFIQEASIEAPVFSRHSVATSG